MKLKSMLRRTKRTKASSCQASPQQWLLLRNKLALQVRRQRSKVKPKKILQRIRRTKASSRQASPQQQLLLRSKLATVADLLGQLGTHFGLDLTARKNEVKELVFEAMSDMLDEDDGDEEHEDEDKDKDADEDK
ncbi:hypothetical protein Droror1_Dr00012561 [Drosera rotundifolia]